MTFSTSTEVEISQASGQVSQAKTRVTVSTPKLELTREFGFHSESVTAAREAADTAVRSWVASVIRSGVTNTFSLTRTKISDDGAGVSHAIVSFSSQFRGLKPFDVRVDGAKELGEAYTSAVEILNDLFAQMRAHYLPEDTGAGR